MFDEKHNKSVEVSEYELMSNHGYMYIWKTVLRVPSVEKVLEYFFNECVLVSMFYGKLCKYST